MRRCAAKPMNEITGKIVIGVVGLAFFGVSVLMAMSAYGTGVEARQVEALPVITSATADALTTHAEVALEGRISERNTSLLNGVVAYVRYEYRGLDCDDDGNCDEKWAEDERNTPALWLDLPAGRLRLNNSDYRLENAPETWRTQARLIENQTREYTGFRMGSPVFAFGAVNRQDGVTLQADTLFGGTRAEYLASQRDSATVAWILAALFGFIGLGLLGLIGYLLIREFA